MKFIKKNMKLIIGLIVEMILVSSLSVYAAYSYLASDVSYTKADGTKLSVQDALVELYNKDYNNTEKPSIKKIYYTDGGSVNYTYTSQDKKTYIACIVQCNYNSIPQITTTGKEIISDLLNPESNSPRKSVIKVINCNEGDTISLSGSNENYNLVAFIYEIDNINISRLADKKLSIDTTANISYTASENNEKTLIIACSYGANRSLDISNSEESLFGCSVNNTYAKIGYIILNKDEKITINAYGYDWGGGTIYILK